MEREQYLESLKKRMQVILEQVNTVPYGQRIPSTWQPPKGYKYEKIELEGPVVEHLIPEEKKTDTVVFHIHGGGFEMALIDAYRESSIGYANIAGGAEVFNIDYRTAPTDIYPAALDDCIKAYEWLLAQGYKSENIVFIGDSAGGNLVLTLTLYLRDQHMPLPKRIIAISPWGDLAFDTPSRTDNIDKDIVIGRGTGKMFDVVQEPAYLGTNDIKLPYISPIYGDYTGFPPLLIQNGTYEMLLDDGVKVYEKAKAAGVNVTHTLYKEMSHDFQLFMPDIEEGVAAWKEMEQFISKL